VQVLGCHVSDSTLASWEQRLVFEREPIFVDDARAALLPTGAVVLDSREFGENYAMAPLDLWDSYDLYRMDRRGLSVAFLTPNEVAALPAAARQELMSLQASRGRGQIYDHLHGAGERDRFMVDAAPRYALRHDTWWAMTPAARRDWLQSFVSEGRKSCLSLAVSEEQWERFGPVARRLAGRFEAVSGPNCFATALAAVTESVALAESIAGHWLHPAPFLRGLSERGFADGGPVGGDGSALPPGSVLLFVDDEGGLQHACYYLGDGLTLNKDGQGWFIPRQVRPVAEVLQSWRDDGFHPRVYTQ